jgi:DNA-binding SARP family transcriptional activator/pimeloyl-ACP methyl ester carboxylesterase
MDGSLLAYGATGLHLASVVVEALLSVLGPLSVVIEGVDVTPLAPKERALLALLIINHGRVVSSSRLMEELWPDLGVDRARRVLQVRVAAVRKMLGAANAAPLLQLVAPGYRLAVAPDDIDEHRFHTLVEQARGRAHAADPVRSAALLREALGLWRGEPLEDVQVCVSLEAEAARLNEARLGAIEDRIDADLACGCHQTVVSELDGLVVTHPLRERLWAQWILAMYRCGREAEALRACTLIRRRLVDELGIEPGPALRALEGAVLEQRPELDWSPGGATGLWNRSRPLTGPSQVVSRSDEGDERSRSALDVIPPVQYARTEDGVNLAYQVIGDGPLDIIIVPGYVSHLDTWWGAWSGRLVRRLASFSRLILFDKRGMGLSDRPPHVDVENWMEDTRVVLDAVGSEQAAVLGVTAGGLIAVLFAATYPERTRSLLLYGAFARQLRDEPDYPIGLLYDDIKAHVEYTEGKWGTGVGLRLYCPSVSNDPVAREQFGKYQRASASPGAASAYLRALAQIDVRHALPMVQAPTLILHPARDRVISVELARYMAQRIPKATLVELNSADHLIWFSDALDVITNEIQDFLTETLPNREIRRVLATVLFIDVVDPHRRSSAGGRGERREYLVGEAKASQLIHRFRGTAVRRAEDGILATFDGPARAIRCASVIVETLSSAGLDVRAGLHSGECDAAGEDIGGVAVEIARGVADVARPGEVLVSQTVRDLVFGSAITFGGPGSRTLRGVPGEWRVYAVTGT